MSEGNKVRWFAIPIPSCGNLPLPDRGDREHRRRSRT